MGNQNGKGELSPTRKEQLKLLEATFNAICENSSDKLSSEKLIASWEKIVDKNFAKYTVNYLTKEKATINFVRFSEPFNIIFNGTLSEKVLLLQGSVRQSGIELSLKDVEQFFNALFTSYFEMDFLKMDQNYKSWLEHSYKNTSSSTIACVKSFINPLNKAGKINEENLEKWLLMNPMLMEVWKRVYGYMYTFKSTSGDVNVQKYFDPNFHLWPKCTDMTQNKLYKPIVELSHILFLNSVLPNVHRHVWRFLFSSKIMGQSFSTLMGKIRNRGATLIIVEEEDNRIFGAYAPAPWDLSPNFTGDTTSFLFKLSPELHVFPATTYNDHYQYLNLNQQTMPNGLGMGGQFNYWGLWLDSDYGLGQSSESCSTFQGYTQLSLKKEFKIKHLEVWGVGDLPVDEDAEDSQEGPSILNRNKEDQVMLELAGKEMYSEGLRDPDLDL